MPTVENIVEEFAKRYAAAEAELIMRACPVGCDPREHITLEYHDTLPPAKLWEETAFVIHKPLPVVKVNGKIYHDEPV